MQSTALADVRVAQGIDATENAMQAPALDCAVNGSATQAQVSELLSRHDPLLASGESSETGS
jgi:hypothetical protein